ncbi:heterocyst frequency control protein PatD [Mastigocladopsis repens]|uniref:heterocyst frequency control protein PatD n=1 Tax=Mastigocladopsis repens TaxID=221287 RepID=UPI00030543CE|nr:heterocyst frequency control protein PatD [Mastigocladopsis repens]
MSLIREKYHALMISLKQLHSDVTTTEVDTPKLRQHVTSLQQFFQQQIVPLMNQDTDSNNQGWLQSNQTEMSKQLRLLEIDVMFFQGARQASTAKTRLDAIGDRLTTLIEYCNAILQ